MIIFNATTVLYNAKWKANIPLWFLMAIFGLVQFKMEGKVTGEVIIEYIVSDPEKAKILLAAAVHKHDAEHKKS